MEQNGTVKGLPENAYTELKEGEVYKPIMSPTLDYPEVNVWSVSLGIIMAIIFSAAAAYLGLRIGQVFEAAIPIAIIAVGLSSLTGRKNALGENVIIQSIGSCSGSVVAGAIFTLPALYILGLQAEFYQIFLSSCLGGFLGILMLIPFRKYFVSDMHGKLPFPEATATAEVLVSGEKGGGQSKLLLIAGLIGGFYDFIIATFGWWNNVFTTRVLPYGAELADKAKFVFKLDVGASIVGLGYIIGLKYNMIICAGSFLSWFVLIPAIFYFASGQTIPVGANVTKLLGAMTPEEIFRNYVRQIGIGGIAMAGIIGIIRSSKIIKSAFTLASKEIFGKHKDANGTVRTNKDLAMSIVIGGIALVALTIFLFYQFGVLHDISKSFIALAIILIIGFLFTTVAANAIAITGNNPVSGMTLMTLIFASIILVWSGLSGPTGMVAALIIGGVMCTALSVAGSFATDLKIGYWMGSSPYKQETWKFLGVIVSAVTVGGVIILLNQIYGFTGPNAMIAPQANAMAAIIEPLMSGKVAPWLLFTSGAFISIILYMLGISSLAFALGMYLPMELTTPLLVGGLISHFVSTRSKDEKLNNARRERGTLITSGFIAGGALMGVFSAFLRMPGINVNFVNEEWLKTDASQLLAIVMFIFICGYIYWDSYRAKVDEN